MVLISLNSWSYLVLLVLRCPYPHYLPFVFIHSYLSSIPIYLYRLHKDQKNYSCQEKPKYIQEKLIKIRRKVSKSVLKKKNDIKKEVL